METKSTETCACQKTTCGCRGERDGNCPCGDSCDCKDVCTCAKGCGCKQR